MRDPDRSSDKVVVLTFPFASPVVPKLLGSLVAGLGRAGYDVEAFGPAPSSDLHEAMRANPGRMRRSVWGRIRGIAAWAAIYPLAQAEMAYRAITNSNRGDAVLLFLGPHYVLPALVSRLAGRRVIYAPGGLASDAARTEYGPVVRGFVKAMETLVLRLAHRVAMETRRECEDLPGWVGAEPLAARGFELPPRERLVPLGQREPVVAFVGRLEKRKGIQRFLAAIDEVEAEARYVVCGTGALEEDVRRAAEENAAVEPRGWVSDEELEEVLRTARLLVIPSDSEGLPTIAIEAMSWGTPVAATKVGGLPELIDDGESGYLIAEPEVSRVAQTIERALSDPQAASVSKNARRRVETTYSHDAASQRYRMLLDRPPRR